MDPGNQRDVGGGRLEGRERITGRTVYTADQALAGMVHAVAVRSPHPHARIVGVDASTALAMAGVLTVVSGRDLSRATFGRRVRDVPVLALEVARFVGERVVAVVAETRAQAEAAAAAVDVQYEPLPAVTELDDALAEGAPRVHEAAWRYVNAVVGAHDPANLQSEAEWRHGPEVEAALRASKHVFTGTFRTPARHQGYLEPHLCTVRVDADVIDVWAPNKSPYLLREQLAAWLAVPLERVRVHGVAIGGDFGGKGSPMDVPLCVLLARRVGRPVRLELRYAEDLMAANPSHPSRVTVRLGVDDAMRMTAVDVDALLDGGAYAGYKPNARAQLYYLASAAGCYEVPALRIRSRIAYTHTVPKGHIRAPGALQVTFAVESLVDAAARELGVDPFAFRAANALRSGRPGALGEAWAEARVEPTLAAAGAALRAVPRTAAAEDDQGEDWAAGVGVALVHQPAHAGATCVSLEPQRDGTLTVWVPFPDQGGGQFTVARTVVVEELGLPPELVHVRQAAQAALPRDAGVGASRVTVDASEALVEACRTLETARARVTARPQGGAAWRHELAALAAAAPGARYDGHADHAGLPPVMSVCAQVARVRVDRGTGRVVVDEIVTAVDVANVINPQAHLGQIEGGVVMGLGHALLEDLCIEEGKVTAANLGDYKLPSIRDVPELTVVRVGGGRGIGRRNVKPIGELTNIAVAPAIANAVADAVGVRVDSLPITAEKVFFALHPEVGRHG